ncbi:MAG: NPCBM/NEW2 domain-containing protein [Pirellulaceae bacterium]
MNFQHVLHAGLIVMALVGDREVFAGHNDSSAAWRDAVLNRFEGPAGATQPPVLALVRQDFEQLEFGRSVIKTPLRLGERHFAHGLGTHSVGHLRVISEEPLVRFSAIVGVDSNDSTAGEHGSVEFVMDPLPYWRFSDAPDRQGISEMKYIEGLYAYWDRIATTWPDSIREECASGGHRMDLETVMRMHAHQKTDARKQGPRVVETETASPDRSPLRLPFH